MYIYINIYIHIYTYLYIDTTLAPLGLNSGEPEVNLGLIRVKGALCA